MALPASRVSDFIERTIQSKIGDTITTRTGNTYPVHHDNPWADPGALREDASDQSQLGFVETRFIGVGAGRLGSTFLQCDVWRRIVSEGEADADPYGTETTMMADAIVEVFTGLQGSGVPKGYFDVLDWTDPLNPVDTNICMRCANSRGQVGEAEEIVKMPLEDGYRRMTLRFRFQLLQDTTGSAYNS